MAMTIQTEDRPNALIVRGWPGQPPAQEIMRLAAEGQRPRGLYVELANVLDADVIDANYLAERGSQRSRLVGSRVGLLEGQVVEAFIRRRRYRHIVAFADRIGLELALLLKVARSRRDLVLISNWLMGPSKRRFLDRGVQSHLGTIIGYGSTQLELAAAEYSIPREKLHVALQPVDERFWRPTRVEPENVICSVGCVSGFRDYRTLVDAVRELPVRVELAVGSLILSDAHKQQRAQLFQTAIPPDQPPGERRLPARHGSNGAA